jgi:hypothetical protein
MDGAARPTSDLAAGEDSFIKRRISFKSARRQRAGSKHHLARRRRHVNVSRPNANLMTPRNKNHIEALQLAQLHE